MEENSDGTVRGARQFKEIRNKVTQLFKKSFRHFRVCNQTGNPVARRDPNTRFIFPYSQNFNLSLIAQGLLCRIPLDRDTLLKDLLPSEPTRQKNAESSRSKNGTETCLSTKIALFRFTPVSHLS